MGMKLKDVEPYCGSKLRIGNEKSSESYTLIRYEVGGINGIENGVKWISDSGTYTIYANPIERGEGVEITVMKESYIIDSAYHYEEVKTFTAYCLVVIRIAEKMIKWFDDKSEEQQEVHIMKQNQIFACPYCGNESPNIDHDYTVEVSERITIEPNGTTIYSKARLGDTVSGVYRCLKCNYETKTMAEFMRV